MSIFFCLSRRIIITSIFIWKVLQQVYWDIWTWPNSLLFCTKIVMVCLKKTKVELELLTDADILLRVEWELREKICHTIHQYTKANKYIKKNYNQDKASSYLMYRNVNNLHRWAMLKKLLADGFKWKNDTISLTWIKSL